MTALKATIEEASGVPASRQRLICRGRVLKDTQRLSELRVEDGDTLHMVQRPPDVRGNPLNDDPAHTAQQQQRGAGGGGGGVNVVQMGSISVPTSALGAQQISQIMSGLLVSGAAASGPGGGAVNADDFAAAAAAAGITPDGEGTIQFTHHHPTCALKPRRR